MYYCTNGTLIVLDIGQWLLQLLASAWGTSTVLLCLCVRSAIAYITVTIVAPSKLVIHCFTILDALAHSTQATPLFLLSGVDTVPQDAEMDCLGILVPETLFRQNRRP